jgi:hypothetical protein
MLKIGILTFHFSDNYGALLQAYALRSWLGTQGHQADFVNYCPSYVEGGGDFQQIWNPSRGRTNAKILYLKLSQLRVKILDPGVIRESLERFRREELGVRGAVYKTLEDVNAADLHYDLLICGSDQIWNPSEQFGVDPVYFLDFRTKTKRKISYAASFGSSELNPEYHNEVARLLRKLSGVSVREQGAVKLVEDLSGLIPVCVPDPTFLVSDYKILVDPSLRPTRKTIFAYILRNGLGFNRVAQELSIKIGAEVISAYNPHRRWKDVGRKVHGGPIEWLSHLTLSEFVITNSFHATVFSILMNRPFLAVKLPGRRAKLSERLENLLGKLGLGDRLIEPGDSQAALELVDQTIDWTTINSGVEDLREVGRSYLRDQINKTF